MSAAFSGYHHRDVPPPDPELTQVGPGTPCGEYLRRFWQPVAFSRDLGAAPRRVRVLGEDLVVFRDRSGRVGVLHLHCAHRGTSLEFGIPLERGLRCCYHGWVYDVDGRCLDTPGEPRGSRLKERGWQGAYPTHEFTGLVFAYLGPPERRPADFDAQSSQRPIAVHALEHLASTDRGVIMLRRIVREGIQAVARGEDPFGARRPEGAVVRTFAQDLVLKVPVAASPDEDRRRLREVGRRVLGA